MSKSANKSVKMQAFDEITTRYLFSKSFCNIKMMITMADKNIFSNTPQTHTTIKSISVHQWCDYYIACLTEQRPTALNPQINPFGVEVCSTNPNCKMLYKIPCLLRSG